MKAGINGPLLKKFYDPSMKSLTYLLGCPKTKKSIILNPVWTSNCLYNIQNFLSKNDWSIKYSLNTPKNCIQSLDSLTLHKMEKIYVSNNNNNNNNNINNDFNTYNNKTPLTNHGACHHGLHGTLSHSLHTDASNTDENECFEDNSMFENRIKFAEPGEKIVCGSIALQAIYNNIESKCGKYKHSFVAWTSLRKDFVFIQSYLMQPTLMTLYSLNNVNKNDMSFEFNNNNNNDNIINNDSIYDLNKLQCSNINHSFPRNLNEIEFEDACLNNNNNNNNNNNDFSDFITIKSLKHENDKFDLFFEYLPSNCNVFPAYTFDDKSTMSQVSFERNVIRLFNKQHVTL